MSAEKRETAQPSGWEAKRNIDPAALAQLTDQVRHLLAFHQGIGLTTYPHTPGLGQFLARVPKRVPGPQAVQRGQESPPQHVIEEQGRRPQLAQQAATSVPSRKQSSQDEGGRKQAEPVQPTAETVQQELKVLYEEVAQCQQCSPGATGRIIPGQGSPVPQLLVVGDCFIGNPSGQQYIWGEQEDAMLWRMMQAIGLEQDAVYVTNAIKCPQPGLVLPDSPMEQTCFSYLVRELQIIRPRLICAMGDIAARALLKTKAPLVRLRNRLHTYRYPQGGLAKIMPTYHPRLLLQYPEMKQATWKDLQVVQRVLVASARPSRPL